MNNAPLVTVGILGYKNYEFIKEAIDSVLMQDYPKIELIISNDGSDDFDKQEVESYIFKNKKKNIVDFMVNNMSVNKGTSKNSNYVLSKANGVYIKLLAADDVFFDKTALRRLEEFAEKNVANVVISRCPAYDRYLERQEWTFPSDVHWNILTNSNEKEVFGVMSEYCIISAPGVMFNTQFLKDMGGANEKYPIIEDWPLWMKMLREGDIFHFLNEPTVKYRFGGVSNNKHNPTYGKHQFEYAEVIKEECLKYKHNMKTKHVIKSYYSMRQHVYEGNECVHYDEYSLIRKLVFRLKNLDLLLYRLYIHKLKFLLPKLREQKLKLFLCGFVMFIAGGVIDIKDIISLVFSNNMVVTIAKCYANMVSFMGVIMMLLAITIWFVFASIDICTNARK